MYEKKKRRIVRGGVAVGVALAVMVPAAGWAAVAPDSGPTGGGTTVEIDCDVVPSIDLFTAGGMNAMIVTDDDAVLTWGEDRWGSTAQGGNSAPSTITRGEMPADADVVSVAYGQHTGYAVTADGEIYAWGMNASGQVGIGSFAQWEYPTPVKVHRGAIPAGAKATEVISGSGHVSVLADNGWVYSWGEPSSGDGTNNWQTEPVALSQGQIPAGVTITQIAQGNGNGYALGSDGWVYAWGSNFLGATGDGTGNASTPTVRTTPVRISQGAVPAGVTFTQIAAGSYNAYGVGTDGHVYAWGNNGTGLLGIGDTSVPFVTEPVLMSAGEMPASAKVTKVVSSELHAMLLADDGNTYSIGLNSSGQLGNGGTANAAAPARVDMTDVPSGVTFTDLAINYRASYALGSDGRLYTWGALGAGEPPLLGSIATAGTTRPVLAVSFGVTEVTFDGIPGTDLDTSGCPITVVTPPHVDGPVDVVVTAGLIAGTTPTNYSMPTTYPGGFTYTEPPVIDTVSLPGETVGHGYSQTVQVTGPGPITLTVTAGELPPGLALDPATGVVSGTPTTAGTYTFTVTATNQYGADTQEYTIVIDDADVQPTETPTPTTTPHDGTPSPSTGGSTGGATSGGGGLALTGGTLAFTGIAGPIGALLTIGASAYLLVSRRRARAGS
ncbi:MAG: putative Ig domain-containing protein [Microbacterium sp.]|nr:putative Ig domain-containing protein [Microbacterium sp.]